MGIDLLIILGILVIPMIAQIYVSSTYNKFKQVETDKGKSGFEVARKILDENGLQDVHIVETTGTLSDHYDPKRKVIRLSKEVFDGETVAAAAIAAHEVGHAIQDKENYSWLRIRTFIYPIVNIATSISYFIIIIGFILEAVNWFYLGIAFVALGLLFQLITLPVEFDASKRAKENLTKYGLVSDIEHDGSAKVLNAAAMTYVAGVLASALQLLRYILLFNNSRNRR